MHAHTQSPPLIWSWSWVGSCVLQRLMKASHLKDRSEDGARAECFQRDSNDLWELKHQRSLPLHNLPLISLCSLPALGYPSEWKRKERASCFYLLSHTPSFSSGYLVQPNRCAHRSCHHRREDVKIEKREPCRHVTAEEIGWGERRWWKW